MKISEYKSLYQCDLKTTWFPCLIKTRKPNKYKKGQRLFIINISKYFYDKIINDLLSRWNYENCESGFK